MCIWAVSKRCAILWKQPQPGSFSSKKQKKTKKEAKEVEHTPKKKTKSSGVKGGIQGYCVRCKAKRPMEGVKEVISKSKMRMAKGTCADCGCKMCKILGKA